MYFLKVTNESFLDIIEEGWASTFLPGASIISDANVKQLASNPKFRKYVKAECQKIEKELKKEHHTVITLEDGIKDGGFGQKIASFYGNSKVKVLNYGLEKVFYDRYDPAQLLHDVGMTAEQIIKDLKELN